VTDVIPSDLPCRQGRADLWFSPDPLEVEQAKRLCRVCPLQLPCLTVAVQRLEPWGVWGGQLLENGRIVPRKRSRGRPRKADVCA
jgi:WhiB family redox-sensing transcriptional regulator